MFVIHGFESLSSHFSMNPLLLSYAFWIKKQGYRESTIRPSVRALKVIAERKDLLDLEEVGEHLAMR